VTPPRVGVNLSTSARPGADPVADARRAEDLGFDFVSVSDHLHGTSPTFETWTLLTWVAASTERIGVVTNVAGLPYRPPPVLAKMAESLDRLTGGRLVLGLGAGGSDEEFGSFGLPVRSPGEKVDALEEALAILRGLWDGGASSVDGRHYRTDGARIAPPAARRLPVWLGAYGRRSLALTGRLADGWLPSMPYAPPDVAAGMLERVRSAAEDAGRDPAELTYAYNVAVSVGGRAKDDRVVAGTPDEVAGRLRELAGLGFTAFNLWPAGESRAQTDLLGEEVLPRLRG
jgi:alkanesulfonate monooxygenase SsuD/methylene tetrahydromethanopterin reductase-like flavin-dependent oxidoreductase (luciferase family)